MVPLSGAVGMKLAKMAGIEPLVREPHPSGGRQYTTRVDYGRWYWPLVEAFDLRNLLERYPGPGDGGNGKGAAFPMARAKEEAKRLRPELAGRAVVMLGRRVEQAFGQRPTRWFEWTYPDVEATDFTYAVIPHPSGLNRMYNDPDTYHRGHEVLAQARQIVLPS